MSKFYGYNINRRNKDEHIGVPIESFNESVRIVKIKWQSKFML